MQGRLEHVATTLRRPPLTTRDGVRPVLFTQDDLLPPPDPLWASFLIRLFQLVRPLDALSWSGGSAPKWGACGMGDPLPGNLSLAYVPSVVVGPIAVRKHVFDARSFNESYSELGKPGMGFDRAWSLALWRDGFHVAVPCAVNEFTFLNGYGGRGTMQTGRGRADRNTAGVRAGVLMARENPEPTMAAVRERVQAAQARLEADDALRRRVQALLPPSGCVRSRSGCRASAVPQALPTL
jgi:hypothetical protein